MTLNNTANKVQYCTCNLISEILQSITNTKYNSKITDIYFVTHPLDILNVPHIHWVIVVDSCDLVVALIEGDCHRIGVFGIIGVCGHVTVFGEVTVLGLVFNNTTNNNNNRSNKTNVNINDKTAKTRKCILITTLKAKSYAYLYYS